MASLDAAACADLLDAVTGICAQTALTIHRTGKGEVRSKPDNSPVTAADEAADAAIHAALSRLAPTLPIISEEQTSGSRPSVGGASYFLVDPLDGTREYIAGRDEYTINIALMTAGSPILGVIAAPALGLLWRGIVGRGAERITIAADGTCSPPSPIRTRPSPQTLVVMVSRSHLEPRTLDFLKAFPNAARIACGSSLKFCRIAEGSADLYPRLAPTRDWDVAAGQAIVEAAGGRTTAPDGAPLRYGSAELLIPGFIATGSRTP